ncbi:hypothetical protein ACFQFC_10450 [Amorphoplanes digitatis]|uniref:Putative membrane protein n=1 Tax=Actinoplanes digitatis TaxID=1868 RepID=A0A7W7MSC7_9ACTN|nr:hypothetical protein [Actinoplanes digitatis]MBB4764617.1 putative membrane protein [Actinoplanes digitatis]
MIDARHDADPAADLRRPRALSAAVRVLAGAGSVIFGLYVGGMNATAYEAEWHVSVFAAVVIMGGVVLIARARRRERTSRPGRIAGTAVGVVGLLAGTVIPMGQVCCDAAWTVSLGLPMPWSTGGGDTWSQAVGDAWHGSWDPVSALANAIFWAYAGMIVAIAADLLRRANGRQ